MSRRHSLLFGFITFILASLACNAFASSVEPGVPLPPPSIEDLTMTPNATVVAGLAATATLPAEATLGDSDNGQASVRVLVDLNIRRGPGVQYGRVGFLLANETAPLLGRDPVSGWWKIICPPQVNEITECWVSGGAQYTIALNADSVPIAAVPPTPTPEPSVTPTVETIEQNAASNTLVTSSEFIVYTTANGLYYAPIIISQPAASLGESIQLIANTQFGLINISPNGEYVAYTTNDDNQHQLWLLNIASQTETLLVNGSELDDDPNDDWVINIANFVWLESSQGLLFNTQRAHSIGPALFSDENLLRVSLTGDITPLLAEGAFAHTISLSGNQIIGGGSDRMVGTTANGTPATTLFEFPAINTASEYIYYPKAQWIDANTAYVSVPDAEPFSAGTFSIWQVSTNGTAVQGPQLPGYSLFNSVLWSPNGSRMVFVDLVSEPETAVLNIANGDGSNYSRYDQGNNVVLYEWRPNSQGWLYAVNASYLYGSEGNSPVPYFPPATGAVSDMQWLNNNLFITAVGERGQWSLISNDLAGNSSTLTIANVDFVQFDVWTP